MTRRKNHIEDPQIRVAIVHDLVAAATWRPWSTVSVTLLTLNIRGPQRVIFCDPAVTISTNLLLIFVCVPHQLEINIM